MRTTRTGTVGNRLLDELCRGVAWACPACGFLVSDIMRSRVRFDPLCRCGACHWSAFGPEEVLGPRIGPNKNPPK